MAKVINLLGGPGSGKSTVASGIFYNLKISGINCELVTEYAKDKTWLKDFRTLENQLYVFANQHHRLWRVADQTDVVIMDSPLLLSAVYGETSETFKRFVVEVFQEFDNMTYFLDRGSSYSTSGRSQTREQASLIDEYILDSLQRYGVEYKRIKTDSAVRSITSDIFEYE